MSKGQQKSFVVAGDAYAKMVMHINKYPYLAVNGVLLGSKSNGDAAIQIVDYIPFFHGAALAPMLEAAMMLVRCHSATPMDCTPLLLSLVVAQADFIHRLKSAPPSS